MFTNSAVLPGVVVVASSPGPNFSRKIFATTDARRNGRNANLDEAIVVVTLPACSCKPLHCGVMVLTQDISMINVAAHLDTGTHVLQKKKKI